MKKFNKKTLIIGLLIIIGIMLVAVTTFGQQWMSPKDLNPPTNLTATVEDENNVNLFWNQPSSGNSAYLHWDNGENFDSFGFMLGAEHFSAAAKWNPEHLTEYDSWVITKMRFYVSNDNPTLILKIWSGAEATEIYSQEITDFVINDWTEVILDNPVVVDAGTELWAGLDIDMPFSGGVMGMDEGPGITGNGDMLYWNGAWYDGAALGIDNNWNIQIMVEEQSAPTCLHWDNGDNFDSFGFMLGAEHFSAAAKWNPEHLTEYDSWVITKMRFYVTSDNPTLMLKIWTGSEATEIYSQEITDFVINDWTEVILDNPVVVDAGTELWAGLDIDMPFSGGVMGMDEGPGITGNGDMLYWNGAWYDGAALGIDNNWNIQVCIEEQSAPTALHWDSGNNVDSFGFFLNAEHFSCAGKWNPEHITAYDGWNITSLKFYVTNPSPTIQLKIWTGPDATEVYSQDITTYNINDWTEIILDTPFQIDASTELWAGIDIDMPSSGSVMGIDEGPGITGLGDMLYWNGAWYDGSAIGIDANWNIQVQLGESKKGVKDLLGYNVYRNDEMINPDPVTSTAFIDANLNNGTYNYYVTAIYDEAESDPSNSVDVQISQTGILSADSLALVDLYNNCNGPNWNMNDLWLSGPVSDWQGVGTVDNRVTSLFVSNNNLTGDIPESFGDLIALTDLHLEGNSITSIPETFGNLESLVECWLGWDNEITSLPESFGNLTNLEELHIGFLDLGTLPESFGNLESLRWLALGDAGLNSLPESFGNLTSLQSCFLWGNSLTSLPENFGGMESLSYLSLYDNQLATIPESFGDLDNLSKLLMDNNQLTTLPESFGDLETLDSLYLEVNLLTSLPESFGNLSDLNYVRLSINNLTELPASITELTTIQEIYVDQNQLTALPENIGDLGNSLMSIGLSSNNLTSLPESMSELTNLYTLFANNNQLTSLPENFGNMANLHILGMDNNNIEYLPESIGDLSLLGYLGMTDNEIMELPESFGNLNADTVLLTNNHIPELPSAMLNKYFDYLWVDNNNLQFGSIEPLMYNVAYEFKYDPQAMIGQDTTITGYQGQSFSYTLDVSGENNTYEWYKNGSLLSDQNSEILYFENVTFDDQGTYMLKVTNTTVSGLELSSYNIEVSIVTGVDEVIANDFHIFPNPATGNSINIMIDNTFQVHEINILNMSGHILIKESDINSNGLNIETLNSGLYFIQLVSLEGDVLIEKLVVK